MDVYICLLGGPVSSLGKSGGVASDRSRNHKGSPLATGSMPSAHSLIL